MASSTPQRISSSENLVWIDLEMTGLDLDTQVIIQAAVIITNSKLEVLEEWSADVWQPARAYENMSPFVRDMHEKNGLLKRCAESRLDLADVEKRILNIVSAWVPHGGTLCGNTIWQDRKFIDKYMPGLGRYLGYRLLDVSSLKIIAKNWFGPSATFEKPKGGEHDALVDIRNSIAELRHYRTQLFLPTTEC